MTAEFGIGPARNFEEVMMNIETTPARGRLQAAVLAALQLEDHGPAGAEAAASAITDVLCAFGEVIGVAMFPAVPMVEGIELVADEQPAQILGELRAMRRDFAERAGQVAASIAVPSGAKLSLSMAELAADALARRVASGCDGLPIGEAADSLSHELLKISARTAGG